MGAMSQSDLLQEAVIPSPFGSVLIRFDQTGQLARIDLRSISASSYCSSRAKNLANSIEAYLMQASLLQVDVTAILEKLDDGTAFQRRVWQATAEIEARGFVATRHGHIEVSIRHDKCADVEMV